MTNEQRRVFLQFLDLPQEDGKFVVSKDRTEYLLTNDRLKVDAETGECRLIDQQFVDQFILGKLAEKLVHVEHSVDFDDDDDEWCDDDEDDDDDDDSDSPLDNVVAHWSWMVDRYKQEKTRGPFFEPMTNQTRLANMIATGIRPFNGYWRFETRDGKNTVIVDNITGKIGNDGGSWKEEWFNGLFDEMVVNRSPKEHDINDCLLMAEDRIKRGDVECSENGLSSNPMLYASNRRSNEILENLDRRNKDTLKRHDRRMAEIKKEYSAGIARLKSEFFGAKQDEAIAAMKHHGEEFRKSIKKIEEKNGD